LRFARANVIATGRGLESLYEKLLDGRARFIQQNTQAEGEFIPSADPFIETIEIERKEDY
jgi:hypothetical protein